MATPLVPMVIARPAPPLPLLLSSRTAATDPPPSSSALRTRAPPLGVSGSHRQGAASLPPGTAPPRSAGAAWAAGSRTRGAAALLHHGVSTAAGTTTGSRARAATAGLAPSASPVLKACGGGCSRPAGGISSTTTLRSGRRTHPPRSRSTAAQGASGGRARGIFEGSERGRQQTRTIAAMLHSYGNPFDLDVCVDIDKSIDKLFCQCKGCSCKNTWGCYECSCGDDNMLYMREHDTCISKEGRTETAGWSFLWVIFYGLAFAGVGAYAAYKYRLRSYMGSEIRAIMAQYMPLDNQEGAYQQHHVVHVDDI